MSELAARARIIAAVRQPNTEHGLWIGTLPTADSELMHRMVDEGLIKIVAHESTNFHGKPRTLHYLVLP